ncbi:hypothetical protein Tco_0762843 [Tanacetum coccineum]
MAESPFNKFKEDKIRVLLVLETEELLQPQGETMQLVKQRTGQQSTIPDMKTGMPMISDGVVISYGKQFCDKSC